MNTDLIGSIELTAAAAIVITALSIGLSLNVVARIRTAAWFSGWFVLVVILAATRALHYQYGLGTPGLGIAVALPIATLCIVVARIESLRETFHRVPLSLLIGVHTVRVLGISFIILYSAARLPAVFLKRRDKDARPKINARQQRHVGALDNTLGETQVRGSPRLTLGRLCSTRRG